MNNCYCKLNQKWVPPHLPSIFEGSELHLLLPEYPLDGPLELRKVRTSGETLELMSSKSFSVSEYLPPLSSSLAVLRIPE